MATEVTEALIKRAENGFVLTYTRKTWDGKDQFSNARYETCDIVYKMDEGGNAIEKLNEFYDEGEEE